MFAWIAAKWVLAGGVKGIAGSIPRGVWIALAVVAILLLGTCAHKRSVKKFGNERYAAGVKAEGDRIAAKALKLAKDAEAISAKARSLNNETNRRIAGDARTVLVRGPGKASCVSPSASSPGRRVAPAGIPDAARPEMSPGDGEALLAAVPWPWLVDRAEQCDLNRAEAETWRAWHKQLEEAWANQR